MDVKLVNESLTYGLTLWQYGPVVGLLTSGVITLSYYLIKSIDRHQNLVDWIREYAIKAVDSNNESTALIDKLTTLSDVNDAKIIQQITSQGTDIIHHIDIMNVGLQSKIDNMKHGDGK